MENPLIRARTKAGETDDPQRKNRLWWESLPMTYQGWSEERRTLEEGEAFRRLESDFLEHNPWLSANFNFSGWAERLVLEIGCGAGAASCLFAKGGAKVTAIDLTEAAIIMTRKNAAFQKLNFDVRRMDAEKLDLPSSSFDFAFSWGVLHHSHDTAAAISEIARVLRPGGQGLIMVYNRTSLRYYIKGLIWLLLKLKFLKGDTFCTVQRFYTDGYYHRHFSPSEMRNILRASGLDVRRLSTTHMAKRMIPAIPRFLDEALKRRWGWLLIAEFDAPACAQYPTASVPDSSLSK